MFKKACALVRRTPKGDYFTAIGSCSVKKVADRHKGAVYYNEL